MLMLSDWPHDESVDLFTFDSDGSRASLRGPQCLECLLGEPIDPAMRTSGEGATTAVRIVDVLGPARLARGRQLTLALDAKPKSEREKLLERD